MIDQSSTGKLIVLEGPDGVGKSTLSCALHRKLSQSSLTCEYLTFPGKETGTIGRLVYDLHHEPEKFGLVSLTAASLQTLHIAAHLDVIEQRIRPAINNGKWVILDRFLVVNVGLRAGEWDGRNYAGCLDSGRVYSVERY